MHRSLSLPVLAAPLVLAACPCHGPPQGSFCYHPPESAGTESTSDTWVTTTGTTEETETTVSETVSTAETMTTTPEECGNGVVEGDEVCDDGADNSGYAEGPGVCNLSCSGDAPYCGDGTCQTSDENANACGGDCTAMCNNGVVEGDEGCDDGNLVNTDGCLNNCTPNECGDGVKWEGTEPCDDGNGVETDACLNDCTMAVCGDGVTWAGVEECDDGNASDVDGCDGMCELVVHRKVFVTAGNYQGGLGGLAGADMKCGMEQGNLVGPFKAWLSDGTTGPANRFDTVFTGVYELADGTMVAHGWSGLTTMPLAHAIDQEADGTPIVDARYVWTNTAPDGTPAGSDHCAGWMNSQIASKGVTGLSDQTTVQWTNAGALTCNIFNFLYCFEDPR